MPKNNIRSTLTLTISCILASSGNLLHADADTGPATITYGSFSVLPLLSTEFAYDDNIFESADNEVDSWVTRINPSLASEFEHGGQLYGLTYRGNYGRYQDSEDDDYDDHDFTAAADLNLGLRNHVDLSANYNMGHEDRGTRNSEGFDPNNPSIQEPLEYHRSGYNLKYAYGSRGATGRIVLAAGFNELEYQNDRQLTRYRDYDSSSLGATFYYQVMPATALLFEVRDSQVDYAVDEPGKASFNSDTRRYLVGATWEITEITTGTVKLGQVEREFDDSSRGDFSGFGWEVDMRWSPRSYSHFDLATAREEEEAYGSGNFIDVKRYELTWTHAWTDLLETRINVGYRDETFDGTDRDEQSYDYGLAVKYQWRRWLAFELGTAFSDRDSNLERLVFERNVYSLAVKMSL